MTSEQKHYIEMKNWSARLIFTHYNQQYKNLSNRLLDEIMAGK